MKKKKVTVAQYLADFLVQNNCTLVSQVSGGMIAFLTDAIHESNAVRLVHNRHEQGSGFAAEGAARVSGRPGIAMATSGPGATNLVTPIASCYFDSTPAIFLTGQVRSDELRVNQNQRQNGFQELNIAAIVEHITKGVWKITDADQVPFVLEEAWELCQKGRPGPVLIDIPIDIQQKEIVWSDIGKKNYVREIQFPKVSERRKLDSAIGLLNGATCPIVLVGGGVRSASAVDLLDQFLIKSKLPFVTTLMGIDSVNHNSPNYLGFIGSYGNRWANHALAQADILLVLGSRLDVRQTGPDVSQFCQGKKILRVDIDENELSGRVRADVSIQLDLVTAFEYIIPNIEESSKLRFIEEINQLKDSAPQKNEQEIDFDLNPNYVMEKLSDYYRLGKGYVVDVGQHQMWAAQSIKLHHNQRFLTSGGLGSMGFAIPASIGAAFAEPGHWVAIVGDGCIQLSIQELQTISQYKLPISVIVINNNQHGMVAQFQDENMGGRFIGTREGYSNPDFKLASEAFGFQKYRLIRTKADLTNFTSSNYTIPNGPELIEIVISGEAKALPKMKSKTPFS